MPFTRDVHWLQPFPSTAESRVAESATAASPAALRRRPSHAGGATAVASTVRASLGARGQLRTALLLGAALFGLVACGGGSDRPERAAGSAVWVRVGDLEGLDAGARSTLREGGIGELFLEAGRLEAGEGGLPRVESSLGATAAAARLRFPVTLAVGGEAAALGPGGGEEEPDAPVVAAELAAQLRRLRLRAEELGLTPVGYHLDLAPPRDAEGMERYARVLDPLRQEVDADLLLSASLDPPSLALEGVVDLARAVDFTVPFLYGARPDGGPSAGGGDAAWDLPATEVHLRRLAELERPFLVGVGTLGRLERLDGEGRPVEATTAASLRDLVRHRSLERGRTAVLSAVDRKDYRFEVVRPGRVGAWTLGRGEALLASRPYPHHLQDLARRAEAAAPGLHLGQLYVRLPAADEGLSLDAHALAAAEGDQPATPELVVEVEPLGGDRSRLRVRLAGRGVHPTDVAALETNYVELRTRHGAAFASVEAGDFQRYQLEYQGERVSHMRALRSADGVKLYAPLVEAGDVVESGPVVLQGVRGDGPVLDVTGVFALPSGELLELPAQPWPAAAGAEAP